VTFTLLDAVGDESGQGLLETVESLIANVFLPISRNVDESQSGCVKNELVNCLRSFVHVLTSTSHCFHCSWRFV